MSTELAWAAGFFDGEGCTTAYRRKNRHGRYLAMSVTQSLPASTLDRFQAAIGKGAVRGPYQWRTSRLSKKLFRQWMVTGIDRCAEVIALLWPYLSEPKREQAAAKMTTVVRRTVMGHDNN